MRPRTEADYEVGNTTAKAAKARVEKAEQEGKLAANYRDEDSITDEAPCEGCSPGEEK